MATSKLSIGKDFAAKSKGLFSDADWACPKCGNINWAKRTTCNMCNYNREAPEEQRTGRGGGFRERDNVEYVNRGESDDEYDEFGRKKKRRSSMDNRGSVCSIVCRPPQAHCTQSVVQT